MDVIMKIKFTESLYKDTYH